MFVIGIYVFTLHWKIIWFGKCSVALVQAVVDHARGLYSQAAV